MKRDRRLAQYFLTSMLTLAVTPALLRAQINPVLPVHPPLAVADNDPNPASKPEAISEAPLPEKAEGGPSLAEPEERPNFVPDRQYLPEQPVGHITFKERVYLQMRTTFGGNALMVPAYESAVIMAHPPDNYPREWSDGGAAFGRNYGGEFARHTTGGFAHFSTAAILHEDPRYYPSESTNYVSRSIHAILFTLVDRSDSGQHTLAISNLAGSAAAGFVTMAYMPDGFNDVPHAYQRAAVEVGHFAGRNLVSEFAPDFSRLLRKFHFSNRISDAVLPDKQSSPDLNSNAQSRNQSAHSD